MKKYLPHLVVLVVLFTAGYLALAQEQQGERGSVAAQEPTSSARGTELGRQIAGEPGLSDTGVVVNFANLARQEALRPSVYRVPRVVREPGRPPRPRTVTAEGDVSPDKDQMEPSAAVTGITPLAPSPTLASSFKALEDINTSIPPDTHGAVGPSHLMVTLNTQIRIQTRTGVAVSTTTLDSFFSAVPGPWAFGTPFTFDPQVFYDPFSSRWMFAVSADPDAPTAAILIAVSQTSDPTGNWKIYKVDVDSTNAAWADYPRMGFNKNWIVITVNMYGVSPASGFKRTQLFVFNKATLYAFAASASFKLFKDTCAAGATFCAFTQTPALTYDNTLNTLYLVEDWDNATKLRISSITGTAAAPTYSTSHPLTTPALTGSNTWAGFPPSGDDFAPQLGSTQKIQVNDSRIQSVVYREGSLWAAHTIFLPNTATPTRSSIQWWQIAPTGAIQQRGRVDDATGNKFYGFPSIAVNKNKDVLIGYSRFSSQQYASANYSFRAGTDPVNTLRDPATLKAGSAPYFKTFGGDRNRWGDYSSTVVDPLNDLDMWTIQEHAAAVSGGVSRWGTWWGRIASITPTPLIQLGTVTARDSTPTPDVDTAVEPGENGRLTIQLRNVGSGAATAVSATLSTTTPGVTITQNASAYPDLAAKSGVGNNSTPFTFSVASSPTVLCSQKVSFTLQVTFAGSVSPVTLNFSITVGKSEAPVTKTYTGAAKTIPDNNTTGVNVTLNVSGFTGNISDLNFMFGGSSCSTTPGSTTVGLDHTWVGDLVVTLKSPQGTVVTLTSRPGGPNNNGVNFCNTTLDDESAGASIQTITPATAPYTGSFKPIDALSAFDGQNPNGTWTLNVKDVAEGDVGHVRNFSLIISVYTCSTTAFASPLETGGQTTPATLLASDFAWPNGTESVALLRAAFLPRRYDHLARLLSG